MPDVVKIEVAGVELKVEQTIVKKNVYVKINRVVGRDRKRKLDITSGIETQVGDALGLIAVMEKVANMPTAGCTCDYRYGWSDHAEHCRSVYVAEEYIDYDD